MEANELKDLRELVEFLKDNKIAEFDLERGDLKVRIKFTGPPAPAAAADTGMKMDSAAMKMDTAAAKMDSAAKKADSAAKK